MSSRSPFAYTNKRKTRADVVLVDGRPCAVGEVDYPCSAPLAASREPHPQLAHAARLRDNVTRFGMRGQLDLKPSDLLRRQDALSRGLERRCVDDFAITRRRWRHGQVYY